jgi:Icc-related predicted phosphoesterase
MRIVHISDTHNCHRALRNLPAADVIIHSGDLSMMGTANEVNDFINWFSGLDYEYKIFIAGNHDRCLEGKSQKTIQRFLPDRCYYLCHSGVEIKGFKFWGVPLFVDDDVFGRLPTMMGKIPDDTDILISHSPPYGILSTTNSNYGCPDLLLSVMRIAPRYHLFGHTHGAYGIEKLQATTFVNASLVNEKFKLVNKPFVFDV